MALAHARHAAHREVLAPRSQFYQGPFGRLFRNLSPWTPPGATEADQIDAIHQIGEASFEGTFDRALDNEDIPAGYTYLGQFVDHDITFDPTSSLQRRNDPEQLHNFRTPRFDLDNIYGRGPDDQPYLYSQAERGKLLIGANRAIIADDGTVQKKAEPDLPRNRDDSRDTAETDDFSRRRVALIGFHATTRTSSSRSYNWPFSSSTTLGSTRGWTSRRRGGKRAGTTNGSSSTTS
jgi:hypothetical protein